MKGFLEKLQAVSGGFERDFKDLQEGFNGCHENLRLIEQLQGITGVVKEGPC